MACFMAVQDASFGSLVDYLNAIFTGDAINCVDGAAWTGLCLT